MPAKRFVVAQIKHETNTFSPIDTPLASFGHGEGPRHGDEARAAFAGTNSPFAAFLDVAAREGAEVVTPIAAESWPSNRASRATFEALVQSRRRSGAAATRWRSISTARWSWRAPTTPKARSCGASVRSRRACRSP